MYVTPGCQVVRLFTDEPKFEGPERPILSSSPAFSIYIVHPRRSNISMYEFGTSCFIKIKKFTRQLRPGRTTRLRGVEFHQSRAARDGREMDSVTS